MSIETNIKNRSYQIQNKIDPEVLEEISRRGSREVNPDDINQVIIFIFRRQRSKSERFTCFSSFLFHFLSEICFFLQKQSCSRSKLIRPRTRSAPSLPSPCHRYLNFFFNDFLKKKKNDFATVGGKIVHFFKKSYFVFQVSQPSQPESTQPADAESVIVDA